MPLVRPCLTTLAGNEPSELGQQGSRKRGGPLQQWVVWKSGPPDIENMGLGSLAPEEPVVRHGCSTA